MKVGEHQLFNKFCGIACVKNENETVYYVFMDSVSNIDTQMLGYVLGVGRTQEEAMENAIKKLVEEQKQMEQKINVIFEQKTTTGERIVLKEGRATYDVDPQFSCK